VLWRAREERADAVIDGSLVLQGVLSSAAIVPLSEGVIAAARKVKPVHVGALDAIHIASALSLGKQLAGVATYDKRMQNALEPLGVQRDRTRGGRSGCASSRYISIGRS
jgi:predicted nucleic acid-binding protein